MISKELKSRILSSLIIIPLVFYFILKGSIVFNLFLILFFLVCCYEWSRMNRKNTIKIIGFFYFFLSCYFAFLLRNILPIELFNLIIIICISTDLGGFFFGKVLKGPKLTKISPKKTYSGMVGSFTLSITVSIVYIEYFNLSSLILMNFSIFNIHNSIFNQVTFIILISLISQVGDLVISYFKRLSKIKDTGKLLPGHGGLLDRVDGIIFAIPFSYLLFKLS